MDHRYFVPDALLELPMHVDLDPDLPDSLLGIPKAEKSALSAVNPGEIGICSKAAEPKQDDPKVGFWECRSCRMGLRVTADDGTCPHNWSWNGRIYLHTHRDGGAFPAAKIGRAI